MDIDYHKVWFALCSNVDPYTKYLSVSLTGRDHAADLSINARIILKWNLVFGSVASFVDAVMNLCVPYEFLD